MPDLAGNKHALEKTLPPFHAAEDLGAHYFDGDGPGLRIFRFINGTHAAAADNFKNGVFTYFFADHCECWRSETGFTSPHTLYSTKSRFRIDADVHFKYAFTRITSDRATAVSDENTKHDGFMGYLRHYRDYLAVFKILGNNNAVRKN